MLQVRVDEQKAATGIVVGIADSHGHRIVAWGHPALRDKRPVDGDTVYDIGSLTKVFTALLLTEMVQKHAVALDDPAAKYLTRVKLPEFHGQQITLADLATHTAGLPLRPGNLPGHDPQNPYAGYTTAELDAFLAWYSLPYAPGSRYEYSNVGYGLLGEVLSARSGETYSALVQQRITSPLGMNATRLEPSARMEAHAAQGYDSALRSVPHWNMGVLACAGGLRSTANDLLKFADAFLGIDKTPLHPAMEAMFATRRKGGMPPADAIALAWNVFHDRGREIVWKNGAVGGFRAFIGLDRAALRGVVALANAQTGEGADDIGLHVLDPGFAVDLEIRRRHVEIALSPDILDRYVGRYRYSPTDIETVVRKGDHLYIVTSGGQPPVEIYAESPSGFFLKGINAQLRFADIVRGHAQTVIWHQAGQDQTGTRVR